MKYINTILLLAIAIGVGVLFYKDHQRDVQLKEQAAAQAARDSAAAAKKDEPSPFDNISEDPMKSSNSIVTGPVTTISFERTLHDFGRVPSGPVYKTSFKFTNTGKEDLIVSNAKASCGCTVPTYSAEPIKPGQSGTIDIEFDSKGRAGEQLKQIAVTTNTEPSENVLTVKSNPYITK
ncbi:MAG: DUF1573 domain-containing protein [Bacteroidetes bacterium]|nr:DUF1573 domain-containing protein [Bacteroidota bacterium]